MKPTGRIAHYAHENKFNAAIVADVNAARTKAGADPDFVWRKNGLRDSFISYRVAAVKNVHQVSLEAGNSPRMIETHYREAVSEEEAKEYFSIAPSEAGNVVAS
jgi:hypothetical protein